MNLRDKGPSFSSDTSISLQTSGPGLQAVFLFVPTGSPVLWPCDISAAPGFWWALQSFQLQQPRQASPTPSRLTYEQVWSHQGDPQDFCWGFQGKECLLRDDHTPKGKHAAPGILWASWPLRWMPPAMGKAVLGQGKKQVLRTSVSCGSKPPRALLWYLGPCISPTV